MGVPERLTRAVGALRLAPDAWVLEIGCGRAAVFARHGLRPEVSVLGPKLFAVAGQSPSASQTSHR